MLATLGLEERAEPTQYTAMRVPRPHGDLANSSTWLRELGASKQPLSLYQRKVLELGKKLRHFMMLSAASRAENPRGPRRRRRDERPEARHGADRSRIRPGRAAGHGRRKSGKPFATALDAGLVQANLLGREPPNPAARPTWTAFSMPTASMTSTGSKPTSPSTSDWLAAWGRKI